MDEAKRFRFGGVACVSGYLPSAWSSYGETQIAEFNRTHERALLVDADNPVLADAHALLARLKPSAARDGLRFAAMPSFGKRWFAVSVAAKSGRGVGEVIVTTPSRELLRHQSFEVPEAQLNLFLRQWDEVTDGYSGEGRSVLDGTPVVFERRRGLRITSGEGNSPCHYDVLGDLVAQTFSGYVPELRDLRDPTLPVRLND